MSTIATPHTFGYATVVGDAIDRAVDYCLDHASQDRSASDLAYAFQFIKPGDDTGKAQPATDAFFWRMVYRRFLGMTAFPSGRNADYVDIPEMFLPASD